jgi:hypothetical protein
MHGNTTTDEARFRPFYEYAADQMTQGVPRWQIEQSLVHQGLDPAVARMVLRDLVKMRRDCAPGQAGEEVEGRSGPALMLTGAAWCIGGILVTGVTMMASSFSGFYIVAWGAILFGGLEFLWGLLRTMAGR